MGVFSFWLHKDQCEHIPSIFLQPTTFSHPSLTYQVQYTFQTHQYWHFPINIPIANMCSGVLHTHVECGHNKKFVPIELCNELKEEMARLGCDESEVVCNTTVVIHTIIIRQPSLCIECFRRVERDIVTDSNSQAQKLELDIASLTRELRGEMNVVKRAAIIGARSSLVEKSGDVKDDRNEKIVEFRFRQGVFADG